MCVKFVILVSYKLEPLKWKKGGKMGKHERHLQSSHWTNMVPH